MTDFCSENKETITVSNYEEVYQNATRKSCLPNNGQGFPFGSQSASGIIKDADLEDHLKTLFSNNSAVAPILLEPHKLQPTQVFADKAAALRKNIQTEYCFYYKRYMFLLEDVLVRAASLGGGGRLLPDEYILKKTNLVKLNSKLNQILQVLQGLINSRYTSLNGYYGTETGVNKLNRDLDTTRSELIRHSEILMKNDLEKETKAAMVEYSIEKNSSSRNLLGIYIFMNIAAAGLIFYLYRSAKPE